MDVNILHLFFPTLTTEELETLASIASVRSLETDEQLVKENSPLDHILLIHSGEVAFSKANTLISTSTRQTVCGIPSFFSPKHISHHSIAGKKGATIITLPVQKLKELTANNPDLFAHLVPTLTSYMDRELEVELFQKEPSHLFHLRQVATQFILFLIASICSFFFALATLEKLFPHAQVTAGISAICILILLFVSLILIRHTHLPLSVFGLTWQNSRKALRESLLFSFAFMGVTLLIKYSLIDWIPSLHSIPVFNLVILIHKDLSTISWILMLVVYSLLCPIQELLVRGCLQGVMEKVLTLRSKKLAAILLSNIIFSTFHLHLSMFLTISVFFVGCMWGWLYSRHNTIVGVSVSHILLGLWGVTILGPI